MMSTPGNTLWVNMMLQKCRLTRVTKRVVGVYLDLSHDFVLDLRKCGVIVLPPLFAALRNLLHARIRVYIRCKLKQLQQCLVEPFANANSQQQNEALAWSNCVSSHSVPMRYAAF